MDWQRVQTQLFTAEDRTINPGQGKLDEIITSCHFIGYPEKSKGFRFYSLGRQTKFVETRRTGAVG
jgi:hypothetical protein